MPINAKSKIFSYLSDEIFKENCDSSNVPITHIVTDIETLGKILPLSDRLELEKLKKEVNITRARAEEKIYANGLKYINCKFYFSFKNNTEQNYIGKEILTAKFLTNPIFKVEYLEKKETLETAALCLPFCLKNSLEDRIDVKVSDIIIHVNGLFKTRFREVFNLKTMKLIKEEYFPSYPITKSLSNSKELLKRWNPSNGKLTFFYHDAILADLQLLNGYQREIAGFKINDRKAMEIMLDVVNKEILAITQKISSSIKIYSQAPGVKQLTKRREKNENTGL